MILRPPYYTCQSSSKTDASLPACGGLKGVSQVSSKGNVKIGRSRSQHVHTIPYSMRTYRVYTINSVCVCVCVLCVCVCMCVCV